MNKREEEKLRKQQEKLEKEIGTRLVYLSAEFYINADQKIPEAQEYEGFPKLENGVGLIASMKEEFDFAIEKVKYNNKKRANCSFIYKMVLLLQFHYFA